MATLSGILSWRIPWTEEPGKLQSIESQRVRHDLTCMDKTTVRYHFTLNRMAMIKKTY